MKHCKYCGSTVTYLDSFGYCRKYACFVRAGKDKILKHLQNRAGNLILLPKYKQLGITSFVTNGYNPRTREANDIMREAQEEFGFVPMDLLDRIPIENREQWDKNIRW